eukprot:879079_1
MSLLPNSYGNALWVETHPGDKKLPDSKQGLLASLFYLTYAASGIAFGPLSIRIGRKPVLLTCIIGITIGFTLQSLATNYWSLVAARTMSGFFAAINGLCQSYISDVCKPQHVPRYTAPMATLTIYTAALKKK